MKIYLFTSNIELIKELELIGLDGVLHTYSANHDSAFLSIIKQMPETNIKHMVAVRPYNISPQLLSQIGKTFNNLFCKNILQINFVTGWTKEEEKDCGGIVGPVNDSSERAEKSKYLQEYIHVLESMDHHGLDYYVSITNNFAFDVAAKYNSKMIIDYSHFEENRYDIKNKKVMVMMPHTASNGSLFSHEELFSRMEALSINGVQEVIFPGGDQAVFDHTINFIKKYKNISELTMVE
jgi:hypothetical protein